MSLIDTGFRRQDTRPIEVRYLGKDNTIKVSQECDVRMKKRRLSCALSSWCYWCSWASLGCRLFAETPCQWEGNARQDAQAIPENRGAAALSVALQKLHTRASMLMVTAHPDDEDGATLAYAPRTLGARVGLLTLNRGEGGANVMSGTWMLVGSCVREQLQADRYYCSSQYFSVAADYGFSKGLDEALQKWGNDDGRVFYDVVRVVRITRPLVITSVFVGGPSDGHGNHAAAGLWAQKVFLAAGDPKVFPDQIRDGLRPWNPLKEYALVPFSLEEGYVSPKGLYDYANHRWDPAGVQNYISGKFEPGAVSATVEVPVGTYSVVNGLSDQQISRTGLGWQNLRMAAARFQRLDRQTPRTTGLGRAFLLPTRRSRSSMASTYPCKVSRVWPGMKSTLS